jgi:DNA-binding response OmpR family regulator
MRIFIVEDDIMLADYLADALEEQHHEVCGIATNVSEAVSGVRLNRPDIAMIDVQLGHGERGTDIAERLASSDDLNGLGILYVSGNADLVQREARFGHACLSKPYGLSALASALTIVGQLMEGQGTVPALPHGMQLLNGMRADLPEQASI